MSSISFSSNLESKYREDLEAILYFNPQQQKVRPEIVKSIEKYGLPEIYTEKDLLRLRVDNFSEVQTIFAFEKRDGIDILIGLIFYVRSDLKNIVLLHIAVKEEFAIDGSKGDEMLTLRLIIKLRGIASRVKGVNYLNIMYKEEFLSKIPV